MKPFPNVAAVYDRRLSLSSVNRRKTSDIKNAVILSEGEPIESLSPQDYPEPQSKDLGGSKENLERHRGRSGFKWPAVVLFFYTFSPLVFAQTNPVPPALEPVTNPAKPNVVPAQTDPFSDPLIKQIQARHEKAVNGDTAETKSLTTDLEKWTKEQPNNHLLQAYLGSVYTLDSRDAWPGPGKLTYLRNGGKELDAAVGAEPDNPAVRFVRAINYYSLPTFFGKRQTARDDFVILVKQTEGVIQTPFILNIETQQAIYYYAGLCYKQLSQLPDAKNAWQRGLKLNPTSPLGVKIAAELTKIH
jgi:hypothetical protein